MKDGRNIRGPFHTAPDHGSSGCALAVPRRLAPGLRLIQGPSTSRGRGEGRVSADTHGPRAIKKHGEGTTGSAGHSGLPCAMALRLIARSPRGPVRGPGLIAPVAARLATTRLGASVGAPGPHAFAVRERQVRPTRPSRPSHSDPTFVTTRTPLYPDRNASTLLPIFGNMQADYFCPTRLTGFRGGGPTGKSLAPPRGVIQGRQRVKRIGVTSLSAAMPFQP